MTRKRLFHFFSRSGFVFISELKKAKRSFYCVVVSLFVLPGFSFAQKAVRAACYYVDSQKGNDANNGKSQIQPWRSLGGLEQIKLFPGDTVRFKRGSAFTGPLYIRNSGTSKHYITLTDYGDITLPAPSFTNPVFKQGNFGNCIRIQGSYVLVENLFFCHTAAFVPGNYQTDGGWVEWEMGAVYIDKGSEHCIVRNNEMYDCVAGIRSYGKYVLIDSNYIHDCNRPLKRWNWGPKGIWLGNDYQKVIHNRVFNMIYMNPQMASKGSGGGAFEIDDGRYPKSHIEIEYNYTRKNHGFLEVVFNDVVPNPPYRNFVIAFNVADDYQSFVKLRKSKYCLVDNNTIFRRRINSNEAGVFILKTGQVSDTFRNNIIVTVPGIRVFNFNGSKPEITVQNNLFYCSGGAVDFGDGNQGVSAIIADPKFVDSRMNNDLAGFSLKQGSPAIGRGLRIGYDTDIFGNKIASVPDMGAIAAKRISNIYYIDPERGDDHNTGTSENAPWQSLSKIQQSVFSPGDSIRFKRGSNFTRQLLFKSSGSAKRYITLCDYGDPKAPSPAFTNPVFAQDNFGNCIRLKGSYVKIENLYFHHTAAFVDGNYQTDGWPVWEMGAIYIDKGATHCIIENNEIEDCVAGIRSYGEHALITHNYIHDCSRVLKKWNWGPIAVWLGADFQEVSCNRIFNYRAEDARIAWPHGRGGGADGGALEIDDARYNKSHIFIHHNYTRDCQGFLEVTWSDVRSKPRYEGFRIHHNISDDYQQFIALWSGARCRIENNTIVRRKMNANDWGVFNITQDGGRNLIGNNIIITEHSIAVFNVGLNKAHHPGDFIEHNLYYAASGKLIMGKEGPGNAPVFAGPLLKNYDHSKSPGDYSITGLSPAIDKGKNLGYDADFFNRKIPKGSAPDIGAFEFQNRKKLNKALLIHE